MNTPAEDDSISNMFKEFEVNFRRPLRWFQWFVWVMVAITFAEAFFLKQAPLPRPAKLAIILASAAFMIFGVLGFVWWLVPRHPLVKQMRPAAQNLGKRTAFALLFYLIAFAAASAYYEMRPTGALALLTALAPSAPLLFVIRAMILFPREETDEFLRSRMLEGWALATGLTLALCTMWGFLDWFELVPHLALWAVFPLWACCLIPAHLILNKRYS